MLISKKKEIYSEKVGLNSIIREKDTHVTNERIGELI